MRFGLVSGNIHFAGSGRSNVIPLAKALNKAGHEVYLIDVSPGFSSHTIDSETSFHIFKVGPFSTLLRQPWLLGKYTKTKRLPWMTAYELNRVLHKLPIDVVYVFSNVHVLPVLLRAPLERAIIVINLIGFGISPDRGGPENTFRFQSEIFSRPMWEIQACATEFEYKAYKRVYEELLLDPRKLQFMPHSYDDSLFFPDDGVVRDRKQIVYPVAVYPRKNIEMLLEVTAKLANITPIDVIITGPIVDQNYFNYLQDRCIELGISQSVSFFKGRLNSGQLADLLRGTDLVLFPSFQETFGIGIVESLACGVPVLLPNDIPALRQFNSLKGVHIVDRVVDSFVEVARNLLGAPLFHNEKVAVADEVRQQFSNTIVARNLVIACREAIAVRQKLRDLNWEGLYDDQPFVESMFQRERSHEST